MKKQFRDIGCRVEDFCKTHFEIVHDQFPAATLINPTTYYLEYATVLCARPGGFLKRGRALRDSLLNELNLTTHLAKITCDPRKIDADTRGWHLQAIARMVTGKVTQTYETESIKNWTNLWLQDIANVVLAEVSFEIVAMLKEPNASP